MKRRIDGASYCFALPDGGWGALTATEIRTSEGSIPLPLKSETSPGEAVLFLVGTRHDGRLLMAGQGHDSGNAWFWDGSEWDAISTTHGVSPCVFGDGWMFVATSGDGYLQTSIDGSRSSHITAQVGSQGFRYVSNGAPVTGDATYRDGELFEWTKRDDVVCGQGHEGGCLINGHVLDPGDRRFIRFERDGDHLAVAMVDQPGHAAVLCWLSRAEVDALPLPGTPEPTPEPHPIPVPQPTPEPKPMPFLPATIKNIRDRYVAKFPVPQGQGPEDFDPATGGASGVFEDKARHWTMGLAEQIVFETGDSTWGVKNAGGGRPQSKDSIAQDGGRLINFDLLSGVGTGHPTLVAEPQGEDITGQTFMPVVGVNHLEAPAPTPVPEPTPTPTPVPTPSPTPTPAGMDDELRAFLVALVEANKDQAKEIKGLRSDVKKAGAALALLVTKKR